MKNDIPHGSMDVGEDTFDEGWPLPNAAGWFWLCYCATIAAGIGFALAVFG